MIWRYCIDPKGLEPELHYGWSYKLMRLQRGAVAVFDTQGGFFICSGSRFVSCPP